MRQIEDQEKNSSNLSCVQVTEVHVAAQTGKKGRSQAENDLGQRQITLKLYPSKDSEGYGRPQLQSWKLQQISHHLTKEDDNLLIVELKNDPKVDPINFFHITSYLSGLAKKSPLVHGITDDTKVELDHEKLLDGKKLYCIYNKMLHKAPKEAVMEFQDSIVSQHKSSFLCAEIKQVS